MTAYGGDVFDAVILAGGRAERLGGVDKPGLEVGGTPMVGNVAAAAREAGRVVIVGPARAIPGAVFVREDPPGAGPVPALRAGLAEVTAPWVVLLAGDLPFLAPSHLSTLLAHTGAGRGAVAVDGEGREQWLLGVWEAAGLREALAAYEGRSLRGLLAPLVGRRVPLPRQAWFDCDTRDDLEEARNERAG
ncbi:MULTISPECIES: molybdenum cofactor guanylyltransferase [Nonomuraea]|uniref:Molybdenum cofactor guanylyltransferase n=1 Tax=Nonomuraea ferruginea TaxID=46174 RepID=A0ABT4T4F2_9ACTN|nr:molybdenum cofactor guanylyltransferase [Nonomuraea ferruginea]MDA0644402.1 molybdenum cofactor guanylyltransferase [Nonomuraea ferruginea]